MTEQTILKDTRSPPQQRNPTDTMSSNPSNEDTTASDASNTQTRQQRRKARKKAERQSGGSGYKKKASNYEGATEEMNKHVYECTTETDNRNQYTRTTEELLQYINKHIAKNKQDILYQSSLNHQILRMMHRQRTFTTGKPKLTDTYNTKTITKVTREPFTVLYTGNVQTR